MVLLLEWRRRESGTARLDFYSFVLVSYSCFLQSFSLHRILCRSVVKSERSQRGEKLDRRDSTHSFVLLIFVPKLVSHSLAMLSTTGE